MRKEHINHFHTLWNCTLVFHFKKVHEIDTLIGKDIMTLQVNAQSHMPRTMKGRFLVFAPENDQEIRITIARFPNKPKLIGLCSRFFPFWIVSKRKKYRILLHLFKITYCSRILMFPSFQLSNFRCAAVASLFLFHFYSVIFRHSKTSSSYVHSVGVHRVTIYNIQRRDSSSIDHELQFVYARFDFAECDARELKSNASCENRITVLTRACLCRGRLHTKHSTSEHNRVCTEGL